MPLFDQDPSHVITGHIAWHGTLNRFMSELFLYAHKPMSYLLWQSGQEADYFFSYVVDLFTISHKLFFLDSETLLWKYPCEKRVYQDKNLHQILEFIMEVNGQSHWQPIVHSSKKPIYLSNYNEFLSI